ncbi:mechanosensitive ion channel domain-containing protein, partial [Bacillus mojavensis]
LGGLAFALAAKDTISNFFGGIIIITEKPFTIGDWVETSTVTGSVEDITFRSTRFRTAQGALVTVPNSTLSMEAITNWTRMTKRQIT